MLVVTHGDFCCPNVLIDPGSLTFTGVLDVERVLRRVGADPSDPRIADYLAFYRKP